MIVLDSIFPVFGIILLGAALRKCQLTTDEFLSVSDNLIYFVFFPAMLFWKIGGASAVPIDWPLYAASIIALTLAFTLSIVCIRAFKVTDYQAGTFSQSCYRFNTYIGMAVVLNALGDDAVGIFGILIGIMIPFINLLAVSALIWYSNKTYSTRDRNRLLVRSLVSNPLILGCAAGILYRNAYSQFPVFIDNTLRLTSFVTLPLALLSIGGNMSFSDFRRHLNVGLLAAAIKLVALPVCGYLLLTAFNITGIPFRVAMIYFALPASTAIFVLSSQLNSDTGLASASIVISTLLSIFSLTVVLALIG